MYEYIKMQGIKNEEGIYETPIFPKLIYILDEYNIYFNQL